jgi:hypothetical protein
MQDATSLPVPIKWQSLNRSFNPSYIRTNVVHLVLNRIFRDIPHQLPQFYERFSSFFGSSAMPF